ncbi:MAG: D-arabinose 5-phosphate isomerase [Bacteroidetes bacterium CG2_30_32_10]|nr:MAG: D-arabinose 5-phosphate isomerase [Bacteroidetes bacterium CG2_30_32_10]
MKTKEDIRKIALTTIEEEALSIKNLSNNINEHFIETVELILNSKGRVIVTGIGKSAIIASKIVATFNSTGTPAIYMHAADAIHGDLGIIRKEDIIICLSKSGNTPEIKVLAPFLKTLGNKLIALVGNTDSYLAKHADYIIDTTVEKEACPNNLAPTSSTTAQLVMGDALAVCLFECRGFTAKDFAKFHPGGSLGKQLYLKVSDLYINNESPKVSIDDDIKHVIMEISSKRLGATAVLDKEKLVGIITDGDLRRMLQKNTNIDKLTAKDIMSQSPKTIEDDILAVDALQIMRNSNITQILVVRKDKYLGVVHLHDILKEGII